jgi:hypothetical protein
MLLTRAGILDARMGSADRVNRALPTGKRGLECVAVSKPPRELPTVPGLVYFQIARGSSPEEWQYLQKSLRLAIWVNENRIAGPIEGQRTLRIRLPQFEISLEFNLFVIARDR